MTVMSFVLMIDHLEIYTSNRFQLLKNTYLTTDCIEKNYTRKREFLKLYAIVKHTLVKLSNAARHIDKAYWSLMALVLF